MTRYTGLCSHCRGNGAIYSITKWLPCEKCNGTGKIIEVGINREKAFNVLKEYIDLPEYVAEALDKMGFAVENVEKLEAEVTRLLTLIDGLECECGGWDVNCQICRTKKQARDGK